MKIQWYPGHMTKARREMADNLKMIDLVIEILDARAPYSSSNPDIDKMMQSKLRLVVLNKSDLADPKVNQLWKQYFENKGATVVLTDARDRSSMKRVSEQIDKVCAAKIERDRKRGIMNRSVKAMVVGVPNAGKSTLINSFAGKSSAKTGNKPGVTKGTQWIRLNKQVELLDTPGILWPKFEDDAIGERLALIGSVKDEIINIEELALTLIAFVRMHYPELLKDRYFDQETTNKETNELVFVEYSDLEILEAVGKRRGALIKGGEIQYDKAASIILEDFRSGRLGKITLERPVESEE